MRDPITVQTIRNAFQQALAGQKISDGADIPKKNSTIPLFQFFDWIMDLISGGEHSNIAGKDLDASKFLLLVDGHNMVHELLNADVDTHGNLMKPCHFKIGHNFTLTQDENGLLVISDKNNSNIKKEYLGVSFNQLKSKILQAYIRETGDPLTDFDGAHNFKGVDFTGFELTTAQLKMLVGCHANISGATLIAAKDDDLSSLDLSHAAINKTMALQLVQAGANPQTVLARYLVTQRELHLQEHETGNSQSAKWIDVDGLVIPGLDLTGIAFTVSNSKGSGQLQIRSHDVDTVVSKIAELQQNRAQLLRDHFRFTATSLIRYQDGDVRNLDLSDVSVNKTMALQLIEAGANRLTVLKHYLMSQREFESQRVKYGMSESVEPIDIGGFNLSGLDLQAMSYPAHHTLQFEVGSSGATNTIDTEKYNLSGLDLTGIAYSDTDSQGLRHLCLDARDVDTVLEKIDELQQTLLQHPIDVETSDSALP